MPPMRLPEPRQALEVTVIVHRPGSSMWCHPEPHPYGQLHIQKRTAPSRHLHHSKWEISHIGVSLLSAKNINSVNGDAF